MEAFAPKDGTGPGKDTKWNGSLQVGRVFQNAPFSKFEHHCVRFGINLGESPKKLVGWKVGPMGDGKDQRVVKGETGG